MAKNPKPLRRVEKRRRCNANLNRLARLTEDEANVTKVFWFISKRTGKPVHKVTRRGTYVRVDNRIVWQPNF